MKKRYKIAMVAACPFPYPRGTPIRILRMAEALSGRGHEVHVVTYHLGEVLGHSGFQIHRIPNIKTYGKLSPGPTYQKLIILDSLLAVKLLKVLRKYDIDLIHAHNYEGLFISLCVRKLTKHPLIYDAHTLLESEFPFYRELGWPGRIKKGFGQRIDRWLPKRADHVISVTYNIKSKLIEGAGMSPEDITVVSNGVSSGYFQVGPEEQRLPPDGKKTLIYAGNLAAYQRIDLLLRAFREVLNKRGDVRLLIVSDSPFDYYEPLAGVLGIRGHIDVVSSEFKSLPGYLAGADIALNPRTDCDGIPQKLLNYMAAGKPIISFEGSARNLEHGKTGWVVENGNISAYADAVLYLLEDTETARRLGENARRLVTSEFTWEKTAEKTEEVYEYVLGNGKLR